MPRGFAIGVIVAAMAAALMGPASANVLDAVYRGTLVCDKLPFTGNKMREAIDVSLAGGSASYTHVVRLRDAAIEPTPEKGSGKIAGQTISLEGSWKGGNREYQARYSGTFVRRSAKLKGTQTWTGDGRTIARNCYGSIKRPLRAFLPRAKKPE